MSTMKILIDLMPALSPILTALIVFYFQRQYINYENKRDLQYKIDQEDRDKRAEARKRESIITLNMIRAVGKMAHATTIALKKNNITSEEIDVAIKDYDLVNASLSEFLQSQATEHYIV